MVPKIHAKGTSFKGAAAYLLHDKGASTADRVGWVETLNLETDDPNLAWRVMAATAIDAPRLKEQAGVKKTGRSSKDSVLHVTLAWAPGETPSREEMRDFAARAIQALKAGDRQAMIICHTDEKHPHVHLLINRVSMKDGRMLPSGKERLALSDLALAYEKERGQVQCPEREKNAEKRAKGERVRAEKDIPRPEYEALKDAQGEVTKLLTPELKARNPQAAAMIRARMKKQFRAFLDGIKETLRPEWRELYTRQRAETVKATEQKAKYIDQMLGFFSKQKAGSPARPAKAFRQTVTPKASWDTAGRQQKQRSERAGIARAYVTEVGLALAEIKINCQTAIRQMFVAHERGGTGAAFGPAAAGMAPDVTPQQAQAQRRMTVLSEKFRNGGRDLEPPEKWQRPKPKGRPPGRPRSKDKDHEPEI